MEEGTSTHLPRNLENVFLFLEYTLTKIHTVELMNIALELVQIDVGIYN